MGVSNMARFAVVFFCLIGWVYSDSANGAESGKKGKGHVAASPAEPTIRITGEGEAAEAEAVEVQSTEPESLFEANGTAAPAVETGGLPAGQTVAVSNLGQIELHVESQDVTKILKLLSLQAQRNIIASRNVAGTVSADLYGVDFYEALEAVLHANGFGYREQGNFIYVYTTEELASMAAAEQSLRKPITRVRRLNYLNSTDAVAFVTPLLSESGSIAVNGETSSGIVPTAGDAGGVSFVFSDTLVIRDFQDNVDEIMALITELDVRPAQVLVEATIMQVRLTEDNAFGTDLSIVLDNDFGVFSNPLEVVDDLITGDVTDDGPVYDVLKNSEAIQSTPGNVLSGESSIKVGVITKNVSVFVRALDRVTDSTVIAKPKALVLNRQRADLLVGERLGYLSTTATETSTTQTVEFLDVGTQLSVRPHVADDGYIRLEINPSVSDGSTVSVGGVIVPNETTSNFVSNVMVRSGQTVVIGGLFKEDTIVSRDQVPGLGDLPIVGAGFRGHDDSVRRSEVIFLITPTVIKDRSLTGMGNRANDSVEVQRIGARAGLLPFSRSKQTAASMRESIKHYDAGDHDKALYYAKQALSLDPTFAEARRMKEQITQEREYWPTHSNLKDSIDVLVEEQRQAMFEEKKERETKQVEAPAAVEPAAAKPAEPEAGNAEPVAEAPAKAETPAEPVVHYQPPIVTPAPAAEPTAQFPSAESLPVATVTEPSDKEAFVEVKPARAAKPIITIKPTVTADPEEQAAAAVVFNSRAPIVIRTISLLDESPRGPSRKVVDAVSQWLPRRSEGR